jgi:hypothetical protein
MRRLDIGENRRCGWSVTSKGTEIPERAAQRGQRSGNRYGACNRTLMPQRGQFI